jgi:primosomal protein N' (replication factor Y)
MYAYCVIEYPVKTLDKTFTYIIPEFLRDKLKVGMKVMVPFNTRLVHGIVLKISDTCEDSFELKEIGRIEDEFLVLNKELLMLGKFLKEETLCNLITAYQTMLPSSLKIKDQKSDYNKYEKYVLLNASILKVEEYINTHRGKKCDLLELLILKGEVNKKDVDSSIVRELEKIGLVKIEARKVYRINAQSKEVESKKLNEEQQYVFDTIKTNLNKNDTFLIHGVTGSGKTLVYINLIKEVISRGKNAILLVPEISLTEQIINIFYDYFGSDVAILHSGLSISEKYDEYVKILEGKIKIVIGTRSAIFAPLENIGIIIIDEEHSDTYKQDNTPRYNALQIAEQRCLYHKAPLILGSATPSLESMARAKKGVYKLLKMNNRAISKSMPECIIVDMSEEAKKRNFIISEELDKEIKNTISRNEQVLLLLNRRGFSTIITCSNCGYTYRCPHCEISLTYHKTSNSLRCHYCGFTKIKDDICPECHEKGLNFLGLGTEKLEEFIKEKYNTKVLRMDADTTANKGMHEKIIKAFRNKEASILLGTQMISKGLDFPDCTLVGIINADATLNIPDFRSSERTFELISQAAGRSGRGEKLGKVIIQTFNPDNDTIKAIKNYDYEGFYNNEMNIRKVLKYPPYYFIVAIKVCSKDYKIASVEASKVGNYLKKNVDSTSIVLGPSTAANFRLKNIYRFGIIVKYRFDKDLKKVLKDLDNLYATNKDVFLEIDFNPLQV